MCGIVSIFNIQEQTKELREKALKMSQNTVRKYVQTLEDKQLISTERTEVITKDGRKRNGTLLYTIRPIREAIDYFHSEQLLRNA